MAKDGSQTTATANSLVESHGIPGPSDGLLGNKQNSQRATGGRLGGHYLEILLAWVFVTLPMLILAIVLIGVMELNDQPDRSRLTSLNGNSATTLPALNVSYGSAVYSRVSAGPLVFISSLSSTLATILLPITMILVSFSVAYSLSRHSDSVNEEKLPSPYQLSLLIGMLDGKLPSLWSFWRYRLGSKKKRVEITQDSWKAMAWLGGVALLALLITLVDAWFHNAITTVQYTQIFPANTTDHMIDSFAPGRGLPPRCFCGEDRAACINSCRSFNNTAGARGIPSLQNATEYGKILAGKSQINMIYSNQHGSIILPATPPSESQFDAQTFGSSTSCTMATEMCRPHQNDANASESEILFSCNISAAGLDLNGSFYQIVQPPGIVQVTEANFSAFDNSLFELSAISHGFGIQWYDDPLRSHRSVVAGTPGNLSSSQLWRGLVFEVETDLFPLSQDLANLSEIIEDAFVPTTLGVVPVPSELVGGILACTSTISEVHYQMINGSVVNDTWASMNETAPFLFVDVSTSGFGKAQLQQGIRQSVASAESSEDIATGIAAAWDQNLLSMVAGQLPGRPPLSISTLSTSQLTRVPVAPFALLVVLDFIYAAVATCLAIMAIVAVRKGHAVRDAQARLSTQAIVAESFESSALGDDAKDVDELFAERRGKPTRRIALVRRRWGGRMYKQVDTVLEKVSKIDK